MEKGGLAVGFAAANITRMHGEQKSQTGREELCSPRVRRGEQATILEKMMVHRGEPTANPLDSGRPETRSSSLQIII